MCVSALFEFMAVYHVCLVSAQARRSQSSSVFKRVIDTTCHVVLGLKKLGHLEEQPVLSDVRVFL